MKNPRVQPPRPSDQKLPRNSTSTATTVWEYAVLLYLALNYILQDNPRHVQYREKVRQSERSTSKYQSEAAHHNGLKSDRQSNAGYQLHKRSQTIPTQSYFQSHNKRRDGHHNEHVYPFKTGPKSPNLNISKAQKSEAWGRIRAVSGLPGYPASTHKWQDGGEKRAKKVRWGVIQTRRFESETAADDGDTTNQHDP
ncbi:hypothetical protein GT037_009761 [Alternaria burnsii]|uniref:Uncharacterized protein n=1 Tax=Alternaria burnsii TaxID=1187904 RepID=A0A8H7EC76_9PLEO|nr:uncharacterized protein GT037_009761 [Alternaria burnsii]KAF7672251.1 hypothetical protein GT037_009761 [Alternaria burnsii]